MENDERLENERRRAAQALLEMHAAIAELTGNEIRAIRARAALIASGYVGSTTAQEYFAAGYLAGVAEERI